MRWGVGRPTPRKTRVISKGSLSSIATKEKDLVSGFCLQLTSVKGWLVWKLGTICTQSHGGQTQQPISLVIGERQNGSFKLSCSSMCHRDQRQRTPSGMHPLCDGCARRCRRHFIPFLRSDGAVAATKGAQGVWLEPCLSALRAAEGTGHSPGS